MEVARKLFRGETGTGGVKWGLGGMYVDSPLGSENKWRRPEPWGSPKLKIRRDRDNPQRRLGRKGQ